MHFLKGCMGIVKPLLHIFLCFFFLPNQIVTDNKRSPRKRETQDSYLPVWKSRVLDPSHLTSHCILPVELLHRSV